MDLLSLSDCQRIARQCLPNGDVDVLSYNLTVSTEAGSGFIGAAKILHIVAKNDGKIVQLDLFTKTLPENDYHKKNVEVTQVFYKEAEFFKTIYPEISRFFNGKTIPSCYHADPDKLLVFENVALDGFRNFDAKCFFDVPHCKLVLSRLASYHASSFLFEKSKNSTIDIMFPHLGCDKIAWFKNEKGHPGYEHCMTGARSLGVVLDHHFSHVPNEVRTKVKNLLTTAPLMITPSKKYRNALSHSDLWCNNIMFKYKNNIVEDCLLVDFQLWGYCPPSMDVYSIIHITTNKAFRDQHMAELLDFYYQELCNNVKVHGANPDEFLPWKEFTDSALEAVPLALSNHAIFLQICLLPQDIVNDVFQDMRATKEFYEVDRSRVVLQGLAIDELYRNRVFAALNDCIDYVTGKLGIPINEECM